MENVALVNNQNITSSLELALNLSLPSRREMLERAPSVQAFWKRNRLLLEEAWKEWGKKQIEGSFYLDDSLINADLRKAVDDAWEKTQLESVVKKLWTEVSPGVFQVQFFEPARLIELRRYLDSVADANIPLRPPYGIALNRGGAMLDPRSEGYLATAEFQVFYRKLLDKYMRPVARMLFPEVLGYDTQTFGFSIQYQAGVDTSLRLHTDASSATLNINVNVPGESFTGSELDFYDPASGKLNRVTFEPGVAMLHRGNIAHAAQPIKSGSRSNLVLWLYGDRMQTPPHESHQMLEAVERWTIPTGDLDEFAPF